MTDDARDAARYRWIRQAEDRDWNNLLRDGGESLDDAIDAAMTREHFSQGAAATTTGTPGSRELMQLLLQAEAAAGQHPLLAHYSLDLYRIRNSLSLDLQAWNARP